ncbi:hypothetical protein [Robertkochia flava]|uniref:hypothetical protein n=1 Tax=Robertkochia flava TaxID=3447986 RepID=UPI001CCBE293|nr:hypothetical protein [Robertkochia marina]
MITLEKKHIDHLYDFVRRHFVPWYDLQAELVDHLATGIEELSITHPDKSFQELLEMEFKKFGVHGFESVVDRKRNALAKEYNIMVFRRMTAFFRWPVILESLFLMVLLYWMIALVNPEWLWVVLYMTIFISGMVGFIKLWRDKRKEEKSKERKWLLRDIILNAGGSGAALFVLPLQLVQFYLSDHLEELDPFWAQFIVVVFMVIFLRLIQVVCWVIPRQIDSVLEDRYKAYMRAE